MRNHTIAIQGSSASFHDIAAKKYFGEEITVSECGSFREVCDKIAHNRVDYGVIAIENRIAGSILLNYQLIDEYTLKIAGEIYLPVQLHLFGKKDACISEIREIISHPMALGQSQNFLAGLDNITISEYKDTSACTKLVSEDSSGKTAVIAGPVAGKKYGLQILRKNVCDSKSNYTRFYVLSKGENHEEDADKASVMLQTKNTPGALCEVLLVLRNYGLNLTKIQSIPLTGNETAYSFHLDIEFKNRKALAKAITELKRITKNCKTSGIYKRGEQVYETKKRKTEIKQLVYES